MGSDHLCCKGFVPSSTMSMQCVIHWRYFIFRHIGIIHEHVYIQFHLFVFTFLCYIWLRTLCLHFFLSIWSLKLFVTLVLLIAITWLVAHKILLQQLGPFSHLFIYFSILEGHVLNLPLIIKLNTMLWLDYWMILSSYEPITKIEQKLQNKYSTTW